MMKMSIALMLTVGVTAVVAFTPYQPMATISSTHKRLQETKGCRPLDLHPDQAEELEAAASVIFSDDNDELEDSQQHLVDDTKHDIKPSLSATSATSSSKPAAKNGWSKSFSNFISNRSN
jgi:hypothetical protein